MAVVVVAVEEVEVVVAVVAEVVEERPSCPVSTGSCQLPVACWRDYPAGLELLHACRRMPVRVQAQVRVRTRMVAVVVLPMWLCSCSLSGVAGVSSLCSTRADSFVSPCRLATPCHVGTLRRATGGWLNSTIGGQLSSVIPRPIPRETLDLLVCASISFSPMPS